jgi:peptidoglycan/xylan/chitin deacetylase (PgdA/CDA1 family)
MKKTSCNKTLRTAAVILAVLIFGGTFAGVFSLRAVKKDNSSPSKFINDEPWYDEELFYWAQIASVWFVPITVFSKLDGVDVKSSSFYKNTVISKGEKYFTIDNDTMMFAYTEESGMFYFKTYMLRSGTIWVPAERVCSYFGLGFEVLASSAGTAVRISDDKAQTSLEQLLATYNPDLLAAAYTPETTTAKPPAKTTAPETETTEERDIEDISYDRVRFTFEDCPNEYTRELLDVLEKHNIRATFFVTGGGIAAYPELISRMAADGHSVGLHSMSLDEKFFAEDIRNFINELEEENALLDRVIKSRTRLVRAPNGSWSDKFHILNAEYDEIKAAGFVVWDWNIYVPDEADAASIYEAIIPELLSDTAEDPVIRLSVGEHTAAGIDEVLTYLAPIKGRVSFAGITFSEPELNFIGVYE